MFRSQRQRYFRVLYGSARSHSRAVLRKISTPSLEGSIFPKNPAQPKPYTFCATETKTPRLHL